MGSGYSRGCLQFTKHREMNYIIPMVGELLELVVFFECSIPHLFSFHLLPDQLLPKSGSLSKIAPTSISTSISPSSSSLCKQIASQASESDQRNDTDKPTATPKND